MAKRALFLPVLLLWLAPAAARADTPTPLPSATAVTATPTPLPTPTATATRTPTPLPTSTPHPAVKAETTPVPTVKVPVRKTTGNTGKGRGSGKHGGKKGKVGKTGASGKARPKKTRTAKASKTPTPTPTATPKPRVVLNAEDSIAPVICTGKARPDASQPFLSPPYHGWTSIVSYFDHDLPDFSQDGLIVTANGEDAAPDAAHQATDFPAYWSGPLRKFLYYDGHNGYDYNLWYQPVYAAASGRVIFARYEYPDATDHGYGQMVMIDHHNGYVTLYGHFSRIEVKLHQWVKRGQEIGISGNTGHSTGPHLHFTVFHNCTPTDPYGWSGSGSDPLSGYMGETARYLWRKPPLVDNPLPGYPGLGDLPGSPTSRLLVLQLPSARHGTAAFLRALGAEMTQIHQALPHVLLTDELSAGAVEIDSPVPPARLFQLPHVISIDATFEMPDAKADFLEALARAAAQDRHPAIGRAAGGWTGSLVRTHGSAFLVGTGEKGREVALRLPLPHPRVVRLLADRHDGAFALDLGPLSSVEAARVQAALRVSHPHKVTVRSKPSSPVRPHPAPDPPSPVVPLALTFLGAAGVAGVLWRMKVLSWR